MTSLSMISTGELRVAHVAGGFGKSERRQASKRVLTVSPGTTGDPALARGRRRASPLAAPAKCRRRKGRHRIRRRAELSDARPEGRKSLRRKERTRASEWNVPECPQWSRREPAFRRERVRWRAPIDCCRRLQAPLPAREPYRWAHPACQLAHNRATPT